MINNKSEIREYLMLSLIDLKLINVIIYFILRIDLMLLFTLTNLKV
jgi:hypothetical protein